MKSTETGLGTEPGGAAGAYGEAEEKGALSRGLLLGGSVLGRGYMRSKVKREAIWP